MKTLLAAAVVTCIASSAFAIVPVGAFDGTSVTGSITFNGTASPNYFDPANGFVPAGYGNSSSPTTTIGSGVEFGFSDAANVDTADFSGNTLTIGDNVIMSAGSWVMTFTDAAFAGANISVGSDDFANGGISASLTGDTITVSWTGFVPPTDPQFTAAINITPAGANAVPDGGTTVGLLALGLVGLGAIKRTKIFAR